MLDSLTSGFFKIIKNLRITSTFRPLHNTVISALAPLVQGSARTHLGFVHDQMPQLLVVDHANEDVGFNLRAFNGFMATVRGLPGAIVGVTKPTYMTQGAHIRGPIAKK